MTMTLATVTVLAVLAAGGGTGAGGALLPLGAERLHASVGGYAVMNCHLDFPFGNEIPYHLQWDKDGESIYSWYSGAGGGAAVVGDRWGGRVRRVDGGPGGLGRGSINVSAVRETDAGLYRCRVLFPNRTPPARNEGVFYRLDVDGGTLILTPPVNVTVREGERAELVCLPKERDSQVEWYRAGEPLGGGAFPELEARLALPANGSLVIGRASSLDPGEYSCRVRDRAGLVQVAAAHLDVQYPAKVVHAPGERYLPLGKPASLDCHFSANPPLTNLRWEKDGFLFDPYNVPGVFYSRNGSLLFNQVDESHEGEYSCTAYNVLGTGGPSPRVRVRVLRPPALAVRPQPLYVARLGGSLTLPCALAPSHEGEDSTPHARVRWTREDGAPLPAGRHSVAGGNLTLMEVSSEDAGGYECRAADDLAARTELLVENAVPRAPDSLRAEPDHTEIHLVWRPGDGVHGSVEYTVWYRERSASEWRTMKILSRGVTEATVGGLRPGTAYELRVLAQDLIGDGLFSKPLFVRTLESEAPAPPEEGALAGGATDSPLEGSTEELEVTVRLLEEGALVRWERGAGGDVGDGPAATCTVRWYDGDRLVATASTRHDYLLVREVSEGAQYAARVACGAHLAGRASLAVPHYSRLRAASLAVLVLALLLAALAAALYLARRRLFPRTQTKRVR